MVETPIVQTQAQGFMIDMARMILRAFGAEHVSEIWATLLMVTVSTILSFSIFWAVRWLLFAIVSRITKTTKTDLDDKIFNRNVLNKAAFLPSIFSMVAFGQAITTDNWLLRLYMKIVFLYMTFSISRFLAALITSSFRTISEKYPKMQSLNSLRQLVVYIVYILMIIGMVSIVIEKNPTTIIGALGASAALMTLVFKETIESLVAGIQLTANNMLSPGDWIDVPKAGANGIVTEVNLNTVKIRNWDNTITTVPPSTLLKDSFTNWRGMKEGDGRRISRSININMDSVRFLTEEEQKPFTEMPELYNYYQRVRKGEGITAEEVTNLALFREYMYSYLLRHPSLVRAGAGSNMRVMVRYLQATQYGMPVELYCFTRTKVWEEYEHVLSEILDHTIATLHRFGLRAYQVTSSWKTVKDDLPVKKASTEEPLLLMSGDTPKIEDGNA